MARKIRLTRKEKREMNPRGSGNSKYARKISRRSKLAKSLGMPGSTPLPILWQIQDIYGDGK